MGLLLVLASEPMLMNSTPLLKMGVIREMGLRKRYKTALSDAVPLFFHESGEVLTVELPKLLGSFWSREETPKDWC